MKQLKFKFDLSSKVAIYVPTTVNVDTPTDNKKQVNKVMESLCKWFGGATSSNAKGGWLSQSKGLVIESVTIVYAFCTESALNEHFTDIINLCKWLCIDMRQEAISLEINGQLGFIN